MIGQQRLQGLLLAISTRKANQRDTRAESGEVHRDIGSAAGLFIVQRGAHHRNRRLGGDALHFAPDVLVEHHVAHDQNARTMPAGLNQREDFTQLGNQSAPPAMANTWLMQVASSTHSHSMCP